MTKKRGPKRLWDFGLVYESELLSRMARGDDRRTGALYGARLVRLVKTVGKTDY